VAISGDTGYIAAGDLHIIDLQSPGAPRLAGIYHSSVFTYHVTVSGDLAFLTKWNDGPTEIVNIADPANPKLVGVVPSTAFDLAVDGNTAFLANDGGLSIYDISNLSAPALLREYLLEGEFAYARGIAIQNHIAFLCSNGVGVLALDVSAPANPTLLGSYDTAGYSLNAALRDDIIFVADESGLKVFQQTFSLSPALALTLGNGVPSFAIQGIAGAEYLLETTDALSTATTWSTLVSVLLTNSPQLLSDPRPLGERAFYRLRRK
jgi:hypothetical protein